MKKIIIQLSFILALTMICFTVLEKNNIKVYNYINQDALNLFFTAITVLFPIGMSIATGIDLSKVVHKAKRKEFIDGLKQTVNSFCVFFLVDCIAMLAILIIQQVKPEVKQIHLLYIFSIIAIFFSVFYFLYNFVKIFNFKRELEDRIFKESQEQ